MRLALISHPKLDDQGQASMNRLNRTCQSHSPTSFTTPAAGLKRRPLEHILVHLPLCRLLLEIRVDAKFCSVINQSRKIKQALFILPTSKEHIERQPHAPKVNSREEDEPDPTDGNEDPVIILNPFTQRHTPDVKEEETDPDYGYWKSSKPDKNMVMILEAIQPR